MALLAEWLSQRGSDENSVYTDSHTSRPFCSLDFQGHLTHFARDASKLKEDGYIYFTAWNIDKEEITFAVLPGLRQHISFDDIPGLTTIIEGKNRIYSNGGAQVFR